jgi:hypothetical protein
MSTERSSVFVERPFAHDPRATPSSIDARVMEQAARQIERQSRQPSALEGVSQSRAPSRPICSVSLRGRR